MKFWKMIVYRFVDYSVNTSLVVCCITLGLLSPKNAASAPDFAKTLNQSDGSKNSTKKFDPFVKLRDSGQIKTARVTINEFKFYNLPVGDQVVERDGCRYESQDLIAIKNLYQIFQNSGLKPTHRGSPWMSTYSIYFELKNGLEVKLFLPQEFGKPINGRLNGVEFRVNPTIIDELKRWAIQQKNLRPDCTFWDRRHLLKNNVN